MSTAGHKALTAMLAVYAGQACIGFVMNRDRAGFESFDAAECARNIPPPTRSRCGNRGKGRAVDRQYDGDQPDGTAHDWPNQSPTTMKG
jgi:hypothetical protein